MVKKGYTPEQIINKLREAEILLSQGLSVAEASRKIGIVEQTYYRWRKEYGGMRVEQAKRLPCVIIWINLLLTLKSPICAGPLQSMQKFRYILDSRGGDIRESF
jgi:hypothetical protein